MKQHSSRFLTLIAETKKQIAEISPQSLKEKMDTDEPLTIFDIREDHEWGSSGHIPTAIHLGRGIVERDIEKIVSDPNAMIVVYCSGGFRCALTAKSLLEMGYTNVHSLETGLQGWVNAGYSLES